jgi:hypothetical protein
MPGWVFNYGGPGVYFIDGTTESGPGNPGIGFALQSNVPIGRLTVFRNYEFANFYLAAPVSEPPVCDADGPYAAECQGTTTTLALDGTGSYDPCGDPLTYLWTTDCPGGTFDDDTSPTPMLTVDSIAPCPLVCNVTLTVTNLCGESDTCSTTVTIEDTSPPDITCPEDVTVTCGESTDPAHTGTATATDNCDPALAIDFADNVIPTICPADPIQEVIERIWTATDDCGNSSSCVQTITVLKKVLDLDIKPESCPNAFNPGGRGVIPISLLGSEEFDVTMVDISGLVLARADCVGVSVAPERSAVEDTGTPFVGEPCDCHDLGGDGILDLSLKFKAASVVSALQLDDVEPGESVELVLSGTLADGCAFIATDCLTRTAIGGNDDR